MATRWDPDQYLRFSDHRLRPQIELLERVPLASPGVIYDLGCGTGSGTRIIADRWPDAKVYGLDSSAEMIQKSSAEPSRIEWIHADISTWQPSEAPDLIYSNATLQWVPGHTDLFPRLISLLRPGGCLAVQVPQSWPMPSHVLMRQTLMTAGPGGTPLGTDELHKAVARKWVDGAEWYYDLLVKQAKTLDIWETEYLQILWGEDPVLEWVSGTGLRPILNGLNDADRAVYLETYRAKLREAYPVRANGETLYPFKRLFIVATV